MRRRSTLILATLLAVAWLGIPFAVRQASGPRTITRHEDPATVAADADPTAIFERYRATLSPFAAGQFAEGRKLLTSLNGATLPPETQSSVRELNALLADEGNILEAADALLRKTSGLIAARDLKAAQPLLAQLELLTRQGSVLLDEGARDLSEVARRMNVDALPANAPQRRAYQDLQRTAARAKALLLSYRAATQHPKSLPALAGLLPYQTTIELSSPPSAYPGRAFTITGSVREQAPTRSQRRLTLEFDGQVLAEVLPGRFAQTVTLPSGTLTGLHRLRAVIGPEGRYLGASASAPLRVIQAVPALQVHAPTPTVVPGRLVISGRATSEFGSTAGATVRARLGNLSTEGLTSRAGEFQLTIRLPVALSLVGRQRLSIELLPSEPWDAPVEGHAELFLINLITAGVVSLVVPITGLAYGNIRRRPRSLMEANMSLPTALVESPATPPARDGYLPHSGAEPIIAIYLEALRGLQRIAGVSLQPNMTFREFAAVVRARVQSPSFTEMTALAELILYSSRPMTKQHEERMRRLARELDLEVTYVA